ncbi:LOW QUALITY PROTEIN: ATP-binding cassette sub-family B member 10, mitochondrial [Jimgerdemannia flammicorona]|uniref:ATP-binding cassette sub-family B member 10, mitochondrial n=1 Tax=Jimgerdemannia flammicorona TaxID=994334 RepID=A0A433QS24_9FUNG|nr:LOW QUALITY PROTEIN: ATP-binding cassette sub-family B member 10, mitochondrial [Jimgerdemannia flammicorona]
MLPSRLLCNSRSAPHRQRNAFHTLLASVQPQKPPGSFPSFIALRTPPIARFSTSALPSKAARITPSDSIHFASPLPRLTPFAIVRAPVQRSLFSTKPGSAIKPAPDAATTATKDIAEGALKKKKLKNTISDARRLLSLARPEAKSITAAIALLIISSAITMSVPFSMGKIIDIVTNPSTTTFMGLTLPQFFMILSGVFVAGALANTGRVVIFRVAGERIIQRLRNDLYKAILRQDMTFFDANRSGDLISRLTNDTNVVGKSLTQNISDGLRSLATTSVGLTMMVFISPKLTAIMMAIVPPVAFCAVFYGRYVRELSRKTQTALGEITKVAEERLTNIRTVQAFAKEDIELERYSLTVKDVFNLAKKEAYASGLFFGGAGLSGNLVVLAVLGYGGHMVMEGVITVGELASFLLYTAYVGGSMAGLTSFYSEVMKGIGAGGRLFELLDRKTSIPTDTGIILPNAYGKITFHNVSFAYPARKQSNIFGNLSLSVEPGTSMSCHPAIAPAHRASRNCSRSSRVPINVHSRFQSLPCAVRAAPSTIGSLLLRFYDPAQGSILINGTDIRDLNLKWWREQIGLVSQEPVLFAGTIAENISYGRAGATMDRIREAAIKANCQGFIDAFPDKYDTFVGERGISLSGGQKQRCVSAWLGRGDGGSSGEISWFGDVVVVIAIARALLKDPSILILDEATSALGEPSFLSVDSSTSLITTMPIRYTSTCFLTNFISHFPPKDSESEALVQDALERLMVGRTVFTIAHRISTIRTANVIACIEDGRVAEIGAYGDLIHREGGVFKNLVQHQLLGGDVAQVPEKREIAAIM